MSANGHQGSIAALAAKRDLPGWDERQEIDYQMALQAVMVSPRHASEADRRKYSAEQRATNDALIERLRALEPNHPDVIQHDSYPEIPDYSNNSSSSKSSSN